MEQYINQLKARLLIAILKNVQMHGNRLVEDLEKSLSPESG